MSMLVVVRPTSVQNRHGRATRVTERPQFVSTREEVLADRARFMRGRRVSAVRVAGGGCRARCALTVDQELLLTVPAEQLEASDVGELYRLLRRVVRD